MMLSGGRSLLPYLTIVASSSQFYSSMSIVVLSDLIKEGAPQSLTLITTLPDLFLVRGLLFLSLSLLFVLK